MDLSLGLYKDQQIMLRQHNLHKKADAWPNAVAEKRKRCKRVEKNCNVFGSGAGWIFRFRSLEQKQNRFSFSVR